MELSDISFGGTKVPWNSMELSGISFGSTKVPWNSMEYTMEFMELSYISFGGTRVPWRYSMEFHGIFHGIPWNTCVILKWRPFEMAPI